jgi:drug/metabolite transporter (DMT)-like permease
MERPMKIVVLIALSVALSGAGQLLLRGGAQAAPAFTVAGATQIGRWLELFLEWRVLAGLLAWTCSTVLWVIVLNRTELAYAYCLGSINYIVVPLLSRWIYGESLNSLRLAGMLLIAAGVAVTLAGREAG